MGFLAGAGLVMILAGLGAYYATASLSWFSIANLAAGPVCLLLAAGLAARRPRGFSGALARRMLLRWCILLGLALGALLYLNRLAASSGLVLDLTPERQYTLAPQTLSLCRELAERAGPRPELLLFEDARLAADVRLLARAYERACPLEVRALEQRDAPGAAARSLRDYETTIVACLEGRCEPVGFPSEQNVTRALLRLVRLDAPIAYFLVGHGELDASSERASGASALVAALRDEGVLVRAWVGPSATQVPADAAVVIAAAPERNLLAGEITALEAYLEQGGRLLALLDPARRSNLEELLERFGFALPEGIVIDPSASPLLAGPQPLNLLVSDFDRFHPITRALDSRTMVILSGARPLGTLRKPGPEDRLHVLLQARESARVERDVAGALGGRPLPAAGASVDPIPLAAAGVYPRGDHQARIVVIGDVDLARNGLLGSLYNHDLILNSVEWLLDDEKRIALRPKGWRVDDSPLTIQQTLGYFYSLAFALPELLLLLGLHAWWRQRGG